MATGKKKGIIYILVLLLAAVVFVVFRLAGPAASRPQEGFLYVKTGTRMNQLRQQLVGENILGGLTWFDLMSRILDFKTVKAGRYRVPKGMSILNLVRMLRNGRQEPVALVITKIRTRQQLAGRLGRLYEFDSITALQFLNSSDSLRQYDMDSNTVMGMVLPLNYETKWNTTPRVIFDKFYDAYRNFWTAERKQKAAAQGLSVAEAISLASIVDEETNASSDKPLVASVYMNRVAKGMLLQADPTVKFALNDFSIKRVRFKHLAVASPYNTYKVKGWPPGPICTPQAATIDSVLQAPRTDYIYFVASSNFDGTHIFTNNYGEHMKYAKLYQQALNQRTGMTDSAAVVP